MKILQVVKTNTGARWALNQAMHLKELGVEVVTVLPNDKEANAQKYIENGMEVIAGNWSLPVKKPWRFFAIRKQIKKTVKEIKPDLIHMHFVTNVMMCRLALRKDKTPRVFQVPGPLHLESKLTSFAERCTATKVDHWAGSCKKTCSIYLNKGIDANRIHLTYYGIVPKKVSDNVAKRSLRAEYGIPNDTLIVGMICYFYKPKKIMRHKRGIKGHEDLIDAMKIVLQKHPNAVLVVIGNAHKGAEEYEQKVKKYAKEVLGDKIIFTGYRNDIYDIYPEIDFVVHPSHSENLGGAAESLLLAVPTISTDVGGFPDIVIPGETGCLAKPKDPIDLAEKITWAIEHPEEMKAMAVKGQTIVSELLDLNNTSSAVYDMYKKILN